MQHPLDKLAELDIQKLLRPHDNGNTAAKITGGVVGAGVGSAIQNVSGSALNRLGRGMSPRMQAILALLTAVGGVSTIAGGAIAGTKIGDRIRPEKSRWTLGLQQ